VLLATHTRETRTIIDALNSDDEQGGKKVLLTHTNKGIFHPVYAFSFHDMQHTHVIVKRLIHDNKELAQVKYSAGLTPAHFAAMGGATQTVSVLLKHSGAAICDAKDVSGLLPLHYAARYGHVETAKILVEANDTRTISDHAGLSALDFAEEGGFQEVVDYLSSNISLAAPSASNQGAHNTDRRRQLGRGG